MSLWDLSAKPETVIHNYFIACLLRAVNQRYATFPMYTVLQLTYTRMMKPFREKELLHNRSYLTRQASNGITSKNISSLSSNYVECSMLKSHFSMYNYGNTEPFVKELCP